MWAAPAQDNRTIQEWHFNILGLKVSADDAAVNNSYRAQILLAHPDRNMTGVNTVAKAQMLIEAKTLLLNKMKRMQFESTWTTDLQLPDFKKNDIVKIHSLRRAKYNYVYGRLVSDNLLGDDEDVKFTVKMMHLWSQYDREKSVVDDSETFNIVSTLLESRLIRVYGEPERAQAGSRWSTYYAKDDRVTIKNVEEAPWYNDTEATIV